MPSGAKGQALTRFRKEVNQQDPNFRKHSINLKHELWCMWLDSQYILGTVTIDQRESWKQVNPWKTRDRSHEGR